MLGVKTFGGEEDMCLGCCFTWFLYYLFLQIRLRVWVCYSSFDLSSIYAVKYHLTMRIRLYQLSFLISTIPGPHSRFPALSDLPVI